MGVKVCIECKKATLLNLKKNKHYDQTPKNPLEVLPVADEDQVFWLEVANFRTQKDMNTNEIAEKRERLGRIVREEWVKWAQEQHNKKPSWLIEWDGLSEPDKEVDRRIGERIATEATAQLQKELEELAAKHNQLMERSVGAMAIAEGDENYQAVPLDCPMLVAVRMIRDNYNLAHQELGAAIVRCGELKSQLATARESALKEAIARLEFSHENFPKEYYIGLIQSLITTPASELT